MQTRKLLNFASKNIDTISLFKLETNNTTKKRNKNIKQDNKPFSNQHDSKKTRIAGKTMFFIVWKQNKYKQQNKYKTLTNKNVPNTKPT